ncbi:hypothetical protein BO82DRAFT_429524 [Aspergillus uvarum CBS 121591]|uniref:Uncharacterized protein n=1 Tax=Aspergillus uvarum CBS 121591 TaxID=1448315 RepID=A0A319CKQ1_9EURO|nr:hypothetical protein BO82DRAFT_429524 [Aspergillus uvarum CBS 121591]PYH85009.1 hypothetical protein BO82DRAFT_429524 [Aspergillus uvarum CBS 121591]
MAAANRWFIQSCIAEIDDARGFATEKEKLRRMKTWRHFEDLDQDGGSSFRALTRSRSSLTGMQAGRITWMLARCSVSAGMQKGVRRIASPIARTTSRCVGLSLFFGGEQPVEQIHGARCCLHISG